MNDSSNSFWVHNPRWPMLQRFRRTTSFLIPSELSSIAIVTAAILVSLAIVWQSFIMLAAIAVLGLTVLFPVEISLGLYAALVPFDQVLVLGNSTVTFTWVAGAFAGTTLILYGVLSGRLVSPPRAGLYWALFLLWAAASTVWALDPHFSLERLPTAVALLATYIVASSFVLSARELTRVVSLTVIGGAVAALLVILQFVNHVTHEGRGTFAIGNQDSNPNELAFSLLLPFAFSLTATSSEKNLVKKLAFLSVLVLLTISIFLTMSRGALLSLLVIVSVYLFRVGIRARTLISILLLAVPLLFVPDQFYDRLKEAPTNRGTGRYDIWIAGFEVVKSSPVIGVGLANFPIAYQKVAGRAHVFPSRGYIREAHNMYLSVCAEMGIIGFGLLVSALWSQLSGLRDRLPISSHNPFGIAVESAFWGQLVAGMSGHIEWSKSFWLTLILFTLVTQGRYSAETRWPTHRLGKPRKQDNLEIQTA